MFITEVCAIQDWAGFHQNMQTDWPCVVKKKPGSNFDIDSFVCTPRLALQGIFNILYGEKSLFHIYFFVIQSPMSPRAQIFSVNSRQV